MDLLAGYGDDGSSEDDEAMPPAPQEQQQQQKQATTPGASVPAAATAPVKLPNPFADEHTTTGPPIAAPKRPHSQVTGHVLSQAPGGASSQQQKAAKQPSRSSPGQGRPAAAGAHALLPPQLRGRSNVVTEDLDKLFTRRQAKPAAAKQQPPSSQGNVNGKD